MKTIFLTVILGCITLSSFAQVKGNSTYESGPWKGNSLFTNQGRQAAQLGVKGNMVHLTNSSDVVIRIKGLYNLKANAFVAIFGLTQVGKSTAEVNKLMSDRIEKVKATLPEKYKNQLHVDMISFVPVYELEEEKKIFSKSTYNEIPAGFELKKNLHIRFNDAEYLHELVTLCADAEIYDLIRVDYFSDSMEAVKTQLMTKAQSMLNERLTGYSTVLGDNNSEYTRDMNDAFQVTYPIQQYAAYQAYSCSSLGLKNNSIKKAEKSTTYYYQPITDINYDFVFNPVIDEPVIQVTYEIVVRINRNKVLNKPETQQYMILTPDGNLKPLILGTN